MKVKTGGNTATTAAKTDIQRETVNTTPTGTADAAIATCWATSPKNADLVMQQLPED